MSALFVDTSALAKRYLVEVGSAWMRDAIAGSIVVISELTTVEMFSLVNRRHREGAITSLMMAEVHRAFLSHVESDYVLVLTDSLMYALVRDLVTRRALRTLDAVQLASALAASETLDEPITFISGDHHLLAAAAAEGFTTDDPNTHP